MKRHPQAWATLGLVFITFLAAIQYVFLQNVPDSVSTFAFVCITNVIGLLILGILQLKRIVKVKWKTLKKGLLLAFELTGMNFFILLGSRHLEAVIISSTVSLYFVFITPMLLLLRKKINFFSAVATVIAIIALLLMFGADMDKLFASVDLVYLIIADIFFASYVVTVSIVGQDEDTPQLTFSQMLFSACFSFAGWLIESLASGTNISIPTQTEFWISALFIGVCIRAIYGIIQISSQKHVSALKASLIFSAEIIITLLISPVLSRLMHVEYTPVTLFQVIGAVLFIIATLMVDDNFMAKLGYEDLKDTTYVNAAGETVEHTSVSKKVVRTTLTFALLTLIFSTVICLFSIHFIRTSAVDNSKNLGESASSESADALMKQLEQKITDQATDKTVLAARKLEAYSDAVQVAASYAHTLLCSPENYPDHPVNPPDAANEGVWTMQRGIENENIPYESLDAEVRLIGNMEEIFAPLIANNEYIAAIYMGTESGFMVSYDPNSFDLEGAPELYYDFKDSGWYRLGKAESENRVGKGYSFTETYQDSFGRGLTITCVAPFYDADGKFYGCVAMDILMSELNASMVNDGVVEPSFAVLIDENGNYIAGKDVDQYAETMGSIFDEDSDPYIRQIGQRIIKAKQDVITVDSGENAKYIAFDTIESTNWTLCIFSPVSSVLQPAVTIRESINGNTDNVVLTVQQGIQTVVQSCLVLSALILIFVTLFVGRASKRISGPLKTLEADVLRISDGHFDQRTNVTTDDEIGSLANSFNVMTDSLQRYIADLKEVTAKEQRIAGELSAATTLQASMLPRNFDDFAGHKEFDLYATMTPAKEVGGDFYDFFMVDQDHLGLVMADVSGKGIPAALFMVVAKTLIKNKAQMGGSPAEVLEYVNEQLCENNEAQLFVTVWLAIMEISTGKCMVANAGHEHPVVRRAGGKYELIVYRHSPAVATLEGMQFKEHAFELHPGDSLFVYTDGVPEATDASDQLFGTQRMLDALNEEPDAKPEKLLQIVRKHIDAYVGGAPQFDDITMMGLHYMGPEGENHG